MDFASVGKETRGQGNIYSAKKSDFLRKECWTKFPDFLDKIINVKPKMAKNFDSLVLRTKGG